MQNRVSAALAALPQVGAGAGRQRPEEIDGDPADRHADLAGRQPRQPLSQQLRDDQAARTRSPACPASATSRCSAPASTRCAIWLDPDKMQARGLTAQDVVQALQQQSEQVAGRPDRHAAGARTTSRSSTRSTCRPPRRSRAVRRRHRQDRQQRRDDAGARHRPRRAWRADLRPVLQARRQAGRGPRHLPVARRQCARRRRSRSTPRWRRWPRNSRTGIAYAIPFDTTTFVEPVDQRGLQDAVRGGVLVLIVILLFLQDWRAMLVPATTVPVTIIGAFAAMAAMGFSVNLSTLFAIVLAIGIVVDDAIVVVEGAAHNIEKGMSRPRRRDQRDGRAVRPDHRHHAGADGGVPAGRLPARPHRPDLRAVRAGDRGDRADQRDQCRDAEADAMRDVAAPPGAAGAAQLLLSRLQPRLSAGWRTAMRG